MSPIIPEVLDGLNSVLEKVIQAQVGLPTGVTDPMLVKIEASIEGAIFHTGNTALVAATRTTAGAVSDSNATPATVTTPTP
jgi:hypothetical protein